jgi:hypothetical protein
MTPTASQPLVGYLGSCVAVLDLGVIGRHLSSWPVNGVASRERPGGLCSAKAAVLQAPVNTIRNKANAVGVAWEWCLDTAAYYAMTKVLPPPVRNPNRPNNCIPSNYDNSTVLKATKKKDNFIKTDITEILIMSVPATCCNYCPQPVPHT